MAVIHNLPEVIPQEVIQPEAATIHHPLGVVTQVPLEIQEVVDAPVVEAVEVVEEVVVKIIH